MPDRAFKDRILAEVARRPSPTRRQALRRSAVLVALAAVLSLAVFWIRGGIRATGRPDLLMIGTAVGAFCLAAVALVLGARRGRSMGGRPPTVLIGLLLATPGALLLWKVLWSSGFAGMTERWPDRAGYRCFWLSLSMMLGPLLALVFTRRRTAVNHPGLTGAALGAGIGAGVWVFVDLWCPVAYTPHLLIGHVLPLVLAMGLGSVLGCWVLGISSPCWARVSTK